MEFDRPDIFAGFSKIPTRIVCKTEIPGTIFVRQEDDLCMNKNYVGQEPLIRRSSGLCSNMLVSFGLLFAVTLILTNVVRTFGIPFTTYSGSYGDETLQILRHLNLVADLEKERLTLWLEERKDDVRALSRNPTTLALLPRLRKAMLESFDQGRSHHEMRDELLRQESCRTVIHRLRVIENTHKVYKKIQVADLETGIIEASTEEKDMGVNLSEKPYFLGAKRLKGDVSIKVEDDQLGGASYIIFSQVMGDPDDNVQASAMVVMFVDSASLLRPLLNTGDALGTSGEVLLVNQDSLPLIPLKHPLPGGTQARELKTRIATTPISSESNSKNGIFRSEDYRGVPVLGAIRIIKVSFDVSWELMVKIDRSEVLGQLWRRVLYTGILSIFGLLAAGGLATALAKRISRPLENLSRVAQEVASGDLSARAQVKGSREVEVLSQTFNSMIERIEGWNEKLDEQVFNLSILCNVSTTIASAVDLNKLLAIVIDEVNKALLTEAAGVLLYDEHRGDLYWREVQDTGRILAPQSDILRLPLERSIAGRVFRE